MKKSSPSLEENLFSLLLSASLSAFRDRVRVRVLCLESGMTGQDRAG